MLPVRVVFTLIHIVGIMPGCSKASKYLYILRHGQALHNPRAEVARANGCSHEEFLRLMQEDDGLDCDLTELGKQQAKNVRITDDKVSLVVSSPLSRALRTADLAFPNIHQRIAIEDVRELNGWLLNAQRQSRTALQAKFPHWNFDNLAQDADGHWTPELESIESCTERGYRGFCWLLERPEDHIALVSHGGILRYTMQEHDLVQVHSERQQENNSNDALTEGGGGQKQRSPSERFGNCELRKYRIEWMNAEQEQQRGRRVVLTELDLD